MESNYNITFFTVQQKYLFTFAQVAICMDNLLSFFSPKSLEQRLQKYIKSSKFDVNSKFSKYGVECSGSCAFYVIDGRKQIPAERGLTTIPFSHGQQLRSERNSSSATLVSVQTMQ